MFSIPKKGKDGKTTEYETLRLNARESMEIEVEELPMDLKLASEQHTVYITEVATASSKKSGAKKEGE